MYPVLFKIGSFELRTYGVMVVLAALVGFWIAKRRAPRYGVDLKLLGDLVFWTMLFGILGARIVFIVQDLPYYLQHTDKLFSIRFEGLTSFGSVLFGFFVFAYFAWKRHVPLRTLMDVCGPSLLVGQAIGRIGCFFNGCCLGGVCKTPVPWGVVNHDYEAAHAPTRSGLLFHPAQLYESLMLLALTGLLILIERKKLRPGQSFGIALIFFGLARFIYELWREGTPDEVSAGLASSTLVKGLGVTEAQIVAVVMAVIGTVLIFVSRRARYTVEAEPA